MTRPPGPGIPIEAGAPISSRERRCAERLAAFGPAALDVLIPLLDDPDRRVGDAAAYAIGRLGERARPAIPALERALAKNSAWVAHALAATADPSAVSALEEAATEGRPVATALVLMGKAGQRAFVDVLGRVRDVQPLQENVDLFMASWRVDLSELVRGLAALVTDTSKPGSNRRVACTLLHEAEGQVVLALPAIGPGTPETLQDCPDLREWIEGKTTARMAQATAGPPFLLPPSIADASRPHAVDAVAESDWKRRVGRPLGFGGSVFAARISPIGVAEAMRRVELVADLGMTKHGYLTIGQDLDWPAPSGEGPTRLNAEIYYAISPQRADNENALKDWEWKDIISALGAVADDTFAVAPVQALTFVVGFVYDDRFLPAFIAYVPRELALRFRWDSVTPRVVSQTLPPAYAGIATWRLKATWGISSMPGGPDY